MPAAIFRLRRGRCKEDWADGTSVSERKRWTWTDYTQDNTAVAYRTNPRVTETKVGDSANTKRTTIAYHLYPSTTEAVFGLPSEVKVYASDQSTVLKQINTEYNLSSNYLSRRIIGLPSKTEASGWNDISNSLAACSKISRPTPVTTTRTTAAVLYISAI